MDDRRITWGFTRRVCLVAGLLFAVPLLLSLSSSALTGPLISAVIALLVLGLAFFASDELLTRVHRIFWRREWPK